LFHFSRPLSASFLGYPLHDMLTIQEWWLSVRPQIFRKNLNMRITYTTIVQLPSFE